MLTANDVALVRTSFAQVMPIQATAADLFYNHLFTIAPELRVLFPSDLAPQKRKLMQMIATAVAGLDELHRLVPAVKALGARHAGYGVTMSHYAIFGEALLWALGEGLGERFTLNIRSAWIKVYGILAMMMEAGAVEATTTLQAAE